MRELPLCASMVPLLFLIISFAVVIICRGADAVQTLSQPILLLGGVISAAIATMRYHRNWRSIYNGLYSSARQVLPTVPILMLIACVSATWMLSGVVPAMIIYGVGVLNHGTFLVSACAISAIVSVMSGSSWTTIGTIGVAFMGIGTIWGYSPAWIAGAVISGAYFGDKVSPLSDTTILASSSCGVKLMTHIRNLMRTSLPAMAVALAVFACAGVPESQENVAVSTNIVADLEGIFNITPWVLLIPAVTVLLIIMRANSLIVLGVSAMCGVVGIIVCQPQVLTALNDGDVSALSTAATILRLLVLPTAMDAPTVETAELIATSGMIGMIPTVTLILSAMVFGGTMMGSGMLAAITHAITRKLNSRISIVSANVLAGVSLNACTGDQYLSIILNGNLFRNLYDQKSLPMPLLSRTVEDSTSVTSVLIPWNSCGLAQSAVLGVATVAYFPCCVFNIASPLMSILFAVCNCYGGVLTSRIRRITRA